MGEKRKKRQSGESKTDAILHLFLSLFWLRGLCLWRCVCVRGGGLFCLAPKTVCSFVLIRHIDTTHQLGTDEFLNF